MSTTIKIGAGLRPNKKRKKKVLILRVVAGKTEDSDSMRKVTRI